MASSKSRASKGSIVKVRVLLKSRRFKISLSSSSTGTRSASSNTASGKMGFIPWLYRMESISVSLLPGIPKMATTSPNGFAADFGQTVIFTSTFSPSLAPFRFSFGTRISNPLRLLSGMSNAVLSPNWIVPTNCTRSLSLISTTAPSSLLGPDLNMRTFTLSPFSACPIF